MSKENKLSKANFVDLIKGLSTLISVTGNVYSNIHVVGELIMGERDSTQKTFEIEIDKLYDAYVNIEYSRLNTVTLKKYVNNRVQSPSLAILKEVYAKCYVERTIF